MTRYDSLRVGDMAEREDGGYVRIDEHEAEIKQLKERVAELEEEVEKYSTIKQSVLEKASKYDELSKEQLLASAKVLSENMDLRTINAILEARINELESQLNGRVVAEFNVVGEIKNDKYTGVGFCFEQGRQTNMFSSSTAVGFGKKHRILIIEKGEE